MDTRTINEHYAEIGAELIKKKPLLRKIEDTSIVYLSMQFLGDVQFVISNGCNVVHFQIVAQTGFLLSYYEKRRRAAALLATQRLSTVLVCVFLSVLLVHKEQDSIRRIKYILPFVFLQLLFVIYTQKVKMAA